MNNDELIKYVHEVIDEHTNKRDIASEKAMKSIDQFQNRIDANYHQGSINAYNDILNKLCEYDENKSKIPEKIQ